MQAAHVPTGCAVWPAFWTSTVDTALWPKGGEIDMLENVNDQFPYNLASVHVNVGATPYHRHRARSKTRSSRALWFFQSAMLLPTSSRAAALR